MIDQVSIPTIGILTLGRLLYLRAMPVQRDVRDAQIPFSRRLRLADFFRRPRSFEVRDSFWVLPYGTLWYAINLPLMHLTGFDGRKWTYSLAILDSLFVWISFRLGYLGALMYVGIGTFLLFKAPWNVSILWLTVCGILSWIFLVLAPVAKFPVGIPLRMRARVQGLLFHQRNYVYYALLGIIWLFVLWRSLLPWLLGETLIGQIVSFGN